MKNYSTLKLKNKTADELKQIVNDYYRLHIQGHVVKNEKTGIEIKFNNIGRKETAKQYMPAFRVVVIMDILYAVKNAVKPRFNNVLKPNHIKNAVIGFINFQYVCKVDNKTKRFRLSVQIKKGGKYQYDFHENIPRKK